MNRYDCKGYIVRHVFGRGSRAYLKPGEVISKQWAFGYGVAAESPSLSEAHEAIELMLRARRRLLEVA